MNTKDFHAAQIGPLPLAVRVKTACRLLEIGPTKMWELIRDGHVQTINIGRRRLVTYASLEALLPIDRQGRV